MKKNTVPTPEKKSKYTADQRPMIEKFIKEYDANGKTESKELSDFLKKHDSSIPGLRIYLKKSDPDYVNPMKGTKIPRKNKPDVTAKLGRPKLKTEKVTSVLTGYMLHVPTGEFYRAADFKPVMIKEFE